MAWYDDSIQGLLEHVIETIRDITLGRIEYEGVEVRQGRPQFQDTDLPLMVPILAVEPITVTQNPVAFGDWIRPDHQGMEVDGLYMVSIWTSRGLPHTPRSGSGGINTGNRILGLLSNDINLDLTFVPDGVQTWNMQEAPAGALVGLAEYDEERDLYEAQALLFIQGEVWRRAGQDGC